MTQDMKRFFEMPEAEYPTIQHELLRPDGVWEKMPSTHLASLCEGPDGCSLLCGVCGHMAYVDPRTVDGVLCVVCLHCRRAVYKWRPLKVLCAAPSHNANGGCRNPLCWKYAERTVQE